MRKKTIFCFLIILIIPFFLSGCYDSVSLEKYYYAIAIAIDTSEKSNFKLSVQVASSNQNSDSSSSSQSTNNLIYSVDCETINLGINIINNFLSKKINLSHCSAIIFSEDISKKGLKEYVNSLANNSEIRPDTHILISNSDALKILENVSNTGEQFSSRYYEFVINSVESTGYSSQSEFIRFFYDINNEYETPTANYITLENKAVQSLGIAFFKKDKYIGHLDSIESLAHLIIEDRLKESIISITNPYNTNSKIDISIKKGKKNSLKKIKLINGKPYIFTEVYITGKILNMPDYMENSDIKIIENELNEYLKNIIDNYYYTIIKKYNIDLANYSDILSNQFLTQNTFKNIKWNDIYKDSFYSIKVNSNLTTSLYSNK